MKKLQFPLFTLLIVIFISSCVSEKLIPLEKVTKQVDTIITFDPITFEESIQIVETEGEQLTPKIVENYRIQIDTIITFDPDTYEETIQIVRTKVKSKNN